MARVHDSTAAFRISSRLLTELEGKAQQRGMSFAELMRAAARRELREEAR